MKSIVTFGLTLAAINLFAVVANAKTNATLTAAERIARREKAINEKMGGMITLKGTPAGNYVIVNAQTKVASDNFDYGTTRVGRWARGLCKLVDGVGSYASEEGCIVTKMPEIKQRHKADFLILIVDNAALPPSLVATEGQWAILNVAALEPSDKNAERLRIRARNEFVRVFCMLSGGFSSQFKAPLTNGILKIDDLDNCLSDPPVDVNARLRDYLAQRGVKAEQKITYYKACELGWAPAPTNQFQKAIWDRVHSLPSNPIKIEYNEKRDKGK